MEGCALRRGIDDPAKVQIDPWPACSVSHEDGRRISRCIAPARHAERQRLRPSDEGLIAFFDQGAGTAFEVVDLESCRCHPSAARTSSTMSTDARRSPAAEHPTCGLEPTST
jgi:hypothetical protein